MDLSKVNAVVTGGASGLGRATAARMLAAGGHVALLDLPSSAGMLATGGGIVFTGKLTGEFIALDEATGKTLWQFKTGSSINSTAITYTHKGKQYITVASGMGALVGGVLCTRSA